MIHPWELIRQSQKTNPTGFITIIRSTARHGMFKRWAVKWNHVDTLGRYLELIGLYITSTIDVAVRRDKKSSFKYIPHRLVFLLRIDTQHGFEGS